MPELLAPAGEPDSGYAALAYGADAVYLGLDRFSARAEAVNFTPEELAEFVGFAHSLIPRRKVFLTLNTLIKQSELAGAAATLLAAVECGVDAVIVQDFGVVRMVRKFFPDLPIHASTQMAVHSLEGALAAKILGCQRVTLARELTLDEVARIVEGVGPGMEVETFIHGTLCYAYSGLCLFSSVNTGRSGNRGRCVYSCREAAETPVGRTHPFSLKDLALGPRVRELADAGVASLKIEGRKKSPLYVAATVEYYRRILDGTITPEESVATEARLRTIFARPWTTLFFDGTFNPDAADPLVVGHRGQPIGEVAGVVRAPSGWAVKFRSAQPVERHDGLQIDVPGLLRPFGFAVNDLFLCRGTHYEHVFAAQAGEDLAVGLPDDAPPLSPGLPVYLSSSQAVKRSYHFSRPKPGSFAPRRPIRLEVEVEPMKSNAGAARLICRAELTALAHEARFGARYASPVVCRVEEQVTAFPARDFDGAEKAARTAFARLGDSAYKLDDWSFINPAHLFVRQGDLNRLRRALVAQLDTERLQRITALQSEMTSSIEMDGDGVSCGPESGQAFTWTIFAESPSCLAKLQPDDYEAAREVIIEVGRNGYEPTVRDLETVAGIAGREKIRLALPLLLRQNVSRPIGEMIHRLRHAGWSKWMVSGLAGLHLLGELNGLDIAADWPLHVLNRMAANELLALGFSSYTLSPEDDRDNWGALLPCHGNIATIVVYSDLPLFVSAACAHSHLHTCGGTPGHGCRVEPMEITMERSGRAYIMPSGCGSVVVGAESYSLSGKLDILRALGARHLRVDFRWRLPSPAQAAAIWRGIRQGELPPGVCGNFDRGLV